MVGSSCGGETINIKAHLAAPYVHVQVWAGAVLFLNYAVLPCSYQVALCAVARTTQHTMHVQSCYGNRPLYIIYGMVHARI